MITATTTLHTCNERAPLWWHFSVVNSPFCLSMTRILSLKLWSGTVHAKKIPLPRTEFIMLGNSFSMASRPSFRCPPVFCTFSRRLSLRTTFRISSSSSSFPGSPIHVLKTRYACAGLRKKLKWCGLLDHYSQVNELEAFVADNWLGPKETEEFPRNIHVCV